MATWLNRIKLNMSLMRRGGLVLAEGGGEAELAEMLTALRADHPCVIECTVPSRMNSAPYGSVVVYHAMASHAQILNCGRPVIADRELRVVIWRDAETTRALDRDAHDFFDWISAWIICQE